MKIVVQNTNNIPNWEYTMTEEDILWSLKMIYGESGQDLTDAACVLWCMVNRFYLIRDKWFSKGFTRFIRAYSQPINPRWYRDGDLAIYFRGKAPTTEDKLQRREHIRDMKEEDFPEDLRNLIKHWRNGEIPDPIPQAIDFAVPSAASASKGRAGLLEKGLEIVYDKRNRGYDCVDNFGNVFYGNNISTSWAKNKISILGDANIIATDSDVKTVKDIIHKLIP